MRKRRSPQSPLHQLGRRPDSESKHDTLQLTAAAILERQRVGALTYRSL